MILIHYTGMVSAKAALDRLTDPLSKVSAHYLIEENGQSHQLVAETHRAWHAGVSFWKGERDCNNVSIGIELCNPGLEFGYRAFPEAQILTLIRLLDQLRKNWQIPDARILGHCDVAPERKSDPGELFPWQRLFACGHGIWPDLGHIQRALERHEDDTLITLQSRLAELGYDSPLSGKNDPKTRANVTAFQRHWRVSKVDGIADPETRACLFALLQSF